MNMSRSKVAEEELEYESTEAQPGIGHRRRTMRDYLHWILRRLWVVVLTMVAGIILGFYVYKKTPKTYASMVTIQVDRQESAARIDTNDQDVNLSGEAFINTLAQKFSLPKYYLELADEKALHKNPNILRKKFSFFSKEDPNQGKAVPGLTPEILAGIMPEWVEAKPAKGSSLMNITVTHTDPEISQIIANGLIEAYMTVSNEENKGEGEITVGRVKTEMEGLRTEISNLSLRKAGYAECLKTKELIDETDLTIAQMSTRYGPKWDPFIEKKKLRVQLQEKFVRELEVVKSGDKEELAYWEAPERGSADPVAGLQPRVTLLQYQLNTAEARLANMDATLQQAQLETKSEGEEFTRQRLAQRGYLIGPKPVMVMAKFTFAGTALGLGIVLLLGFLDPGARTVSDLEGLFDLPILGAIPIDKAHDPAKEGERRKIAHVVTDHSPPAEAIRNLRAGLSFLGNRGERRSFLFTSSLPGEGKSWVSANLAVAFGAQGDKTLVIDLDLRKPTQHKIFGMERTPGVTDFLTQGTPIEEVFRRTENENVYLITAGSQTPNPSELLTPKNLRLILSHIPKEIDRIIIDTSPVLAVRDALAPATMVDSTIVVFKMAKTPVKALDRLLKVMAENNTYPVGIVANALPNTKKKGYGYYGDYYYGYHGYGEYYGEEEGEGGDGEEGEKPKRKRTRKG